MRECACSYQDATHGALPTLRAATAMDAAQGSYHGPGRMFQLKGDPVLVPIPKPARDEPAALLKRPPSIRREPVPCHALPVGRSIEARRIPERRTNM